MIYCGLNGTEAALAGLEKAVAVRDVRMTQMSGDRRWFSLNQEPRFIAVMRAMKFGREIAA